MQYCSGGELFDRIVKHDFFSETVAAHYLKMVRVFVKHASDAQTRKRATISLFLFFIFTQLVFPNRCLSNRLISPMLEK